MDLKVTLVVQIHEEQDDYGKGGYPDSKTTGHTGAALACCKITYQGNLLKLN